MAENSTTSTQPLPPVPVHTKVNVEHINDLPEGIHFDNTWNQWFVQLREKVKSLNENLIGWGSVPITSGVTPGTYGDATHIPEISVDAHGIVTDVNLVTLAGAALTTKGDLLGFTTFIDRYPVGPNTYVLTADDTTPFGWAWIPPAAGGVVSVVAGTGITVDSTDPANPVVSASASSGGDATLTWLGF